MLKLMQYLEYTLKFNIIGLHFAYHQVQWSLFAVPEFKKIPIYYAIKAYW